MDAAGEKRENKRGWRSEGIYNVIKMGEGSYVPLVFARVSEDRECLEAIIGMGRAAFVNSGTISLEFY